MTDYGLALFPRHAELLKASGIDPEVAHERGYVSADTKANLGLLGFSPSQRIVPALVIPILGVTGERVGTQIRPDTPRHGNNGKPIKYETPRGMKMALDVHPRVRPHLSDPTRLLVGTEGSRKADAAVSRGIDAVALLGVWNWRGSNDKGGTVALPDWESVALNGRRVAIAFDSDVMLKEPVQQALVRGAFLASRGAHVLYVYLPSGPGGVKVGLDDWLVTNPDATVDDLLSVAVTAPKVSAIAAQPTRSPPTWDGTIPLADVWAALTRYVAFPDRASIVATVLWIVHTWLTEEFDSTPRLSVSSPEKESGKTRLLEVLTLLCREARLWTHISAATLYRRIGQGPVTPLIDEVDNIFVSRNDPEKADLRSVINEGHRRGATVPRCVGANRDVIEEFPVYAPLALAGIGALPDTLASRSITIAMRRRTATEPVEQFRQRQAREQLAPLRERIEAWAETIRPWLRGHVPVMPTGVEDRAADCWEPLLSIAEAAGPDWAEEARAACVNLVQISRETSASLNVRLLRDCKAVMDGAQQITTFALLDKLHQMDPWASLRGEPLDAIGLARLLKPYKVEPGQVWVQSPGGQMTSLRGYTVGGDAGFFDAWRRYCPDPPDTSPDINPEQPARPARPTRAQVSGLSSADGSSTSSTSSGFTEGDTTQRVCDVCDTTEKVTYFHDEGFYRCVTHNPYTWPPDPEEEEA